MAVEIPSQFGWVILTIVFSGLVHHGFMASRVTSARKKYNVKYPALYAAEAAEGGTAFNCVQRGHQNSLEVLATHYLLTVLVGIRYPLFASLTGLIYVAGRIQYFRGYATGVPKNRLQGGFMYIGLAGQILAAIFAAFSIMRS